MLSKLAEKILMIPGWQGQRTSQLLADDLKRSGDDPVMLNYDSHKNTAEQVVDSQIIPALERNPGSPVFTHSTGGLLLRLAATKRPDLVKGRKVVLTAPAVQGSPAANVARWLGKIPFTPPELRDKMLGDLKWGSTATESAQPMWNADVTLVEGYKAPKPTDLYGYLKKITLTPFGPNDGVLPLKTLEKAVPEANHLYKLPYGHSQLLTNPSAREQLLRILTKARATGRQKHAA